MQNAQHSLTDKQRRWIDEYLIDFNGAAAAVRAGYSERSARSIAHENATKPDIQVVLLARQAALAQRMAVTQAGIVQGLVDAVEMARIMSNPAAMVSGLREIAKMLGYYEPEVKRVEMSVGQKATAADFAGMSDKDLLALIEQGAAVS